MLLPSAVTLGVLDDLRLGRAAAAGDLRLLNDAAEGIVFEPGAAAKRRCRAAFHTCVGAWLLWPRSGWRDTEVELL